MWTTFGFSDELPDCGWYERFSSERAALAKAKSMEANGGRAEVRGPYDEIIYRTLRSKRTPPPFSL